MWWTLGDLGRVINQFCGSSKAGSFCQSSMRVTETKKTCYVNGVRGICVVYTLRVIYTIHKRIHMCIFVVYVMLYIAWTVWCCTILADDVNALSNHARGRKIERSRKLHWTYETRSVYVQTLATTSGSCHPLGKHTTRFAADAMEN